MSKPNRAVSYARILIKGREGYALLPSKENPKVKRWMKLDNSAGKASISPSQLEKGFMAYLNDPDAYRQMPPALTAALLRGEARLPYDVVAQLSRAQTAAWQGYGGYQDLIKLIEGGQTAAGQFGQDHLALMEHLSRQKRPLLTDTYDAYGGEFEGWAGEVEKGVEKLGGKVLGAIPRTSAFEWDWNWGPPDPRQIRQDAGERTILINPEATLVIAPPEGREAEFAREYWNGIVKDAPKSAEKAKASERLSAIMPSVIPWVKRGQTPPGRKGEKYRKALKELQSLQSEEAALHREAYERGEKLSSMAWYEPDTRGNYAPGEGWNWGRLTATENGIHYISSDLDEPGPQIVVGPAVSQWIGYSRVGAEDIYRKGAKPRSFAQPAKLEGMNEELKPFTFPYWATLINFTLANEVWYDLYGASSGGIDENDDAYDVPFRLANPDGGAWVAVFASDAFIPSTPGPWRNVSYNPFQVLWVNERGQWGYSSYDDLSALGGSLRKLREAIRPVSEFPEFKMPPALDAVLRANAEHGWPLERLVALARGEVTVDNPTLKLWSEEGNPELLKRKK
ncbi:MULTISPECIES: hypothetical protein [unclassified Meiothermus]|uniref:hypothetical protein n=1 Tax=unclassified Meiothermus TaxID=370471 RepID=UPI000D7CA35F|nr:MULTISPECIES: hypothetical protein [unclassified Meiothermus]PZA06495.1 hypothetical protein DNA98_12985 [Meiothermus sp. Pnk-1]RYM36238.1 hypothetical protein EWH23_10550 [Meiothermus sp. PNK-Is4]